MRMPLYIGHAFVRLAIVVAMVLLVVVSELNAQSRDISVEQMRSERRVALVIGNAAYTGAVLKNPIGDARAMDTALKALNFAVLVYENLSEKDMRRAIDAFGEKLRGSSVGFFYFSGHGLQVKGRNYLVPVDAKLAGENDVEYDAVDVGRVLGKMENVKNRLNIVVLDACRNNPFEKSWSRGPTSGGLAQVTAPTGTFIAYAAAPGRVANDGSGANGVYTSELLKAIQTPGLTLEAVFKQVGRAVALTTKGGQEPWMSSSVYGDFFFMLPREGSPSASLQAQPTDAGREAERIRQRQEDQRRLEQDRARLDAERKQFQETQRIEKENQERERERGAAAAQEQAQQERQRAEEAEKAQQVPTAALAVPPPSRGWVPPPPQSPPTGALPSFEATVTGVRFYETSGVNSDVPIVLRRYAQTFPLPGTRAIAVEVNLGYRPETQRREVAAEAIWYGPEGLIGRQTGKFPVEAGWTSLSFSFGALAPGSAGSYHVELVVDGRPAADGAFVVSEYAQPTFQQPPLSMPPPRVWSMPPYWMPPQSSPWPGQRRR